MINVASGVTTNTSISDLFVAGVVPGHVISYGKWFVATMFIVLMAVSFIPELSLWFR